MLPFYFILTGIYLYYSKSKYFPSFLPAIRFNGTRAIAFLFLIIGMAYFVYSEGWASGILLSLTTSTLGMIIVQLFSVLGRKYFYGLVVVVHALVLIELISYAR